jgi:hypothetical protein
LELEQQLFKHQATITKALAAVILQLLLLEYLLFHQLVVVVVDITTGTPVYQEDQEAGAE